MSASNRSTQLAKVQKILKKHYKAVAPDADRSVLEHLLFACCLEDAQHAVAEEAYAAVVHTFFDWNEVRVTSIAELSEVMAGLPDPRSAANRLKRVLQSVFEELYAFDLEDRRKKNLGPTVKWLEKLDGTTPFVVSYVVQAALGGHAIPVGRGVMGALYVVELVTEKDVKACKVPGLERAIPKSKGIEFGSMLHQFGADFVVNPYSPALREILLQIDPGCKERLPKRRSRKKAAEEAKTKTEAAKKAKSAEKKTAKKAPAKAATKKTTTRKKAEAPAKKVTTKKKRAATKKTTKKKSSSSAGISKRKPR